MMLHSPTRRCGSAPRFLKRAGTTITILGAIAIACGLVTHRAQASEWDKMTKLTVNEPIQVSDTYLDPGTYVFKLADVGSSRHIVQIFDGDQSHIINTVMAIPNYRLEPTGNTRFTFWETPPGNVKAMRAWFYPGDNFGQEFRYPKQLRQIAVVRTPEVLPAPPQAAPPAPAPQPEAVVPEASNVQPNVQPSPAPAEQPVEIAQATPPPASPPAQAPQAEPAPQELPKTASPYTTIGLGGLMFLGLFGVVRLARAA